MVSGCGINILEYTDMKFAAGIINDNISFNMLNPLH